MTTAEQRGAAEPSRMRTADFAVHVDLSLRHVQRLVDLGTLPSAGRGFVAMPGARLQYIHSLRRAQEKADNGIGKAVPAELAQVRLERDRLSLHREQLAFHRDAGALIAIDDATSCVVSVVEAVRGVLQLVPRKHGTGPDDRARLKAVCNAALAAAIDASTTAVQRLAPKDVGDDDSLADEDVDDE